MSVVNAAPSLNENHGNSNYKKHWLDYATALCALIAAIAAIFAAMFGWYQGQVARDGEIWQLRPYIGTDGFSIRCPACEGNNAPGYACLPSRS